jgi:catechol 2,3-dioxygenase
MNYYYHQDAIHVSRVDLYVKNLDKSLNFYQNSLGFSILDQNEEYTSLTANHKNELIRLYENHKQSKSNKMNIYHFALLLPTRKDLSRFLHHLIIKQIPIDGAADHLVSEAIYLRDPDGIGIEITCDRDDQDWQIKAEKIIMDSMPFDYKGVYYETENHVPFSNLPEDTVIGHLHLQVSDLNKAKEFYQEIIGFRVTNDEISNAIFMSDKNYHHHLAINTWYRQKERNDEFPKMRSFTINYPNCEKYLKTIENLKKANIDIQETSEGIYIKDIDKTTICLKI